MQLILVLFLFLTLWAPAASKASTCTDGVDCYCDKVTNPSNEFYDPNLLLCEDWEAPPLHDNSTPTVRFGNGVPYYGPWYDHSNGDFPNHRGANSYWNRTYGSPANFCSYRSKWGDQTPIHGIPCIDDTCGTAGEWSLTPGESDPAPGGPGDLWGANEFACIDIYKNGELDDEVPGEGAGPIKPDDSRGVWDGNQGFAHRVGPGWQNDSIGSKGFGKSVTTLGITMALAYSANVGSSNIWAKPWKHDEFEPYNDYWNLGGKYVPGAPYRRPYAPFLFTSWTIAQCQATVDAATIGPGLVNCVPGALFYAPSPDVYNQPTDFPWGTWGCHQAYISGLGTSNITIRLWHNSVLIFQITGLDGTQINSKYFTGVLWNAYSNTNTAGSGGPVTTETVYRHQDNIHYTEGTPVSCDQIGFGAAPIAPVPKTTEGVNFGQGVSVN